MTGQKSFGAAALEALCGLPRVEVVGVAAPGAGEDRLRHEAHKRGLSWTASEDWRADSVPEGTDLIVAAHSHAFIGRKSRARSRWGAIGYHPSLLPRHRGRDAVRWTIHMQDPIAGGTVYYFTDNVDCGPIIAQDWLHVKREWDHHDLWNRLFQIGISLLVQVVETYRDSDGHVCMRRQDPEVATWEPSWQRPPLHRPELPELNSGNGQVKKYTLDTSNLRD